MSNAYEWEGYGYAKSPFRLPTQRACEGVFQAAKEATRFGAESVTPEHLLLALTYQTESMTARILDKIGVSLEAIRQALEPYLPAEQASHAPDGLLLSSSSKQVIDQAYEAATQLDNRFLGVEHLLFGLLRCPESQAQRVLTDLGLSAEQIREEAHIMKWG
jgi:ATP-dependent Clp protease ATP-binding subunit ClpC